MRFKHTMSALLAVAMIITSVGCVQLDQNGQPATSAPPIAESVLFEDYLMDSFREAVGDNLFDCRFMVKDASAYGITDVPLNIGRIDFEQYDDAAKLWQEDYDELSAFKYDELTEEQQLIYDLIKHDMDTSKDTVELGYLNEYNSPLLGIQSQLTSLLPEFKLYTVQDAYDYITMMENVPLYFDDMLEFQRRKSERGLFMSDTMLDNVIKSCENVIATPESNALIIGFPERIAELPDITTEQTEKLTELNRKAFIEDIVPAYEAFIKGIETLRGTGKNEGGLAGYEGGKEYYEYLVKEGTGSDRSVSEIAKMIDTEMNKVMTTAGWVVADDEKAWERYIAVDMDYGTPHDIMKLLEEATAKDFPKVANLNYDIKEISPELEEHSSPAFFIIPQIDDPFNNSIYINNKYLKDDAISLFTTLAHEGYPGHMYQSSYFNSSNPHPMRRLLHYSGYSEGWASYVEELAYEMAGIDDDSVVILMQVLNKRSLLLSSRIDIGVNYEGWNKAKLKEYLSSQGFDDDSIVDSIFSSVVEDPANYLSYSVGMLEMQKLRRYAEIELEGDFDAAGFHSAVLDIGPSPYVFVKKSVDKYIDSAKAVANPAKAA